MDGEEKHLQKRSPQDLNREDEGKGGVNGGLAETQKASGGLSLRTETTL